MGGSEGTLPEPDITDEERQMLSLLSNCIVSIPFTIWSFFSNDESKALSPNEVDKLVPIMNELLLKYLPQGISKLSAELAFLITLTPIVLQRIAKNEDNDIRKDGERENNPIQDTTDNL